MNQVRSRKTRTNSVTTSTQRALLPLFAVGSGLASLPAAALELGDVTVESRLGQPLRASIAFALAPNEELSDSCVTLGLGASASGLPGAGRATLSIADGTILLTGKSPIREPMIAAMINVDCAYTANLSREYLMFIDPAEPVFDSQSNAAAVGRADDGSAQETVAPAQRASTSARSRNAANSSTVDRTPIGQSTRYRVQAGDTLSQIVERIENRSTSLWPAVNAIFDANPDAFIDNDPNKLKAGSWLSIPSFLGAEALTAVTDGADGAPADNPASSAAVNEARSAAAAPTAILEASSVSTQADSTSDLSPVATETRSDNPFVHGTEIASDPIVIPDTELEGPETVSASPNVTTAVINTESAPAASSPSWLMWLAGAGIALIAALLLFGRLFRGRPSEPEVVASEEIPTAIVPQRRATDHREPGTLPDDGGIEVVAHTDYTIEDDSPTSENVALDADLVMGTGLDSGAEMEVAEDFGFASPTEVDLELPFEPEPSVPESDTGIFAADEDDTSVLEGNELTDDDDYDLSVVLDATKMPRPEDVTQRDLQAVEVEPKEDIAQTGSYTISSEVDLEILEQDYEDELTATQALNAEIARAAKELANEAADPSNDDYEITSEITAATPLTSVAELDATAAMPESDEGATDENETGIHEAATIEMPAADNDETAEMELDGGKVDTKAV